MGLRKWWKLNYKSSTPSRRFHVWHWLIFGQFRFLYHLTCPWFSIFNITCRQNQQHQDNVDTPTNPWKRKNWPAFAEINYHEPSLMSLTLKNVISQDVKSKSNVALWLSIIQAMSNHLPPVIETHSYNFSTLFKDVIRISYNT